MRSWRRRSEGTRLRAACADGQSRKLLTEEHAEREISMITQAERGAETKQPNSPFTHHTWCTASEGRWVGVRLSFCHQRCERLSCTREGQIKGEEKPVETSFFLCFSKSLMTNFPTQGKITAPSGNRALAPSAPVRGEKASTVGSSQPAAKQTAREAAISIRYQSHSSGIVITHVLHPSSVRAYLMPLRLQTQEPLTMRIYMEHIWRQTGSLDQERISNQKSTISGDRVKLS